MSIDWTNEAIEAALDAFDAEEMRHRYPTTRNCLRAALDAALAAQGCPKLPDCKTYADRAYADGRANALEEAARLVAQAGAMEDARYGHDLAKLLSAIRALKETEQ